MADTVVGVGGVGDGDAGVFGVADIVHGVG